MADEQVEFTSEQIQAPDSANPAPWKWTSSSVTVTIVALNALVYILMLARGLSWIQPSAYDLLAWGADYGPRTLDGQWWRMFVSLFLHYGIIHLAFNMWVLANIGPFIESLSGRASFLILYIVAGLGGGAASLVWHPTAVGAGASGAIFGLYGALLAFLLRHRKVIAPEALASLRKGALVFVGYNLLFGLARPEVDMAAHVGGLCTGFLLGLLLVRTPSQQSSPSTARNAIAVAFGAALVIVTLLALPKPGDLLGEFKKFGDTEDKAISLFKASSEKWKASQISNQQFADVIEQQILPNWRAEHETVANMKNLPPKQVTLTASLVKYMNTREQGWTLLVEGLRAGDGAKIGQAVAMSKQADQLADKIGVGGK